MTSNNMLKNIENGIERDGEFQKIINGDFSSQSLEYQKLYPIEKYRGEFPVRILRKQFEIYFNHYSKSVRNALNRIYKSDTTMNIVWKTNNMEIHTPSCSIYKNGNVKLKLYESYIAYLWGVSYFIFLLYESKAQHDKGMLHTDKYFITDAMLSRSEILLRWALSLKSKITPWDDHLPSPLPTALLIDSEAAYCWQVSELCCYALTFIAYHELSHVILGINHSTNPKRQEQDADNLAMSFMKDPLSTIPKDLTIFGILLASIGTLFFLNSPNHISSKTHPDPDIRITNVLNNMVDKSNELAESYEYAVSIAFRTFSMIQGIDDQEILNGKKKTPRQIIELYLELFDNYRM